jgi:hypothetical protein
MGKVLYLAKWQVLLDLFEGDRGGVSIWEFVASTMGVLRYWRLDVKLILINHLGREFQFGT